MLTRRAVVTTVQDTCAQRQCVAGAGRWQPSSPCAVRGVGGGLFLLGGVLAKRKGRCWHLGLPFCRALSVGDPIVQLAGSGVQGVRVSILRPSLPPAQGRSCPRGRHSRPGQPAGVDATCTHLTELLCYRAWTPP